MQKVFCDGCGVEIETVWFVSIGEPSLIEGEDHEFTESELCEECYKKVKAAITD